MALTHVPDAVSIPAAGRPPECTQKYWPCKSNSVRLGSLPRELTARRLPSGCRPGFWPQGQWDLLYSFASQVAGASRSASTSSGRLSPYGFFTTVDPTVSGGAVRLPRRCLPCSTNAQSEAETAPLRRGRLASFGRLRVPATVASSCPRQSSPGARDDESVLVRDAGSILAPGILSEARRRLKMASAGPGAFHRTCRRRPRRQLVERLLVVRERLPALGSHERVVVTAH